MIFRTDTGDLKDKRQNQNHATKAKMSTFERTKTVMHVMRMTNITATSSSECQRKWPFSLSQPRIRKSGIRESSGRENTLKMRFLSRNFITNHRSKIPVHLQLVHDLTIIHQDVVILSDRQIQTFSSNRDYVFCSQRISLLTVGEGVCMGTATDPAVGIYRSRQSSNQNRTIPRFHLDLKRAFSYSGPHVT